MNSITDFKTSLQLQSPPEYLSVYLRALWYDAKGDWHVAHQQVDQLEDETACWVHAYLHRKEGDEWNAGYWYRRANKKKPAISLEQEWQEVVCALL